MRNDRRQNMEEALVRTLTQQMNSPYPKDCVVA